MHLSRALFGADREVRIRTSYFPFTEPSIESTSRASSAAARAAASCAYSGWIEMGGAGVVDPNVFELRRLRPRGGVRASPSASGWSGSPCSATASRTCARSGRTTSDSCGSSDGARSPSPGCASTSRSTRRRREIAERLAISTFELERIIVPRRARRRRQPRPLPRRARARGGQAPERRPAPALHGGRGGGRAAPDRLRRVELRRGRDGRGRAARRRPARRRRSSSRRSSAAWSPNGMILSERELELGPDHSRDHRPRQADRPGHAAGRRPAARRGGDRGGDELQPARPASRSTGSPARSRPSSTPS